jgi:DNA helicase-2/ATP-dependent DNA helicase PcrA
MDLLAMNQPAGFGSVQLMTMSKARGLEADVVVIVGLEDDLIPNPSSNLEEEARLFYVSMTRAKQKLFLIHSYKRLRSISFGPEVTGKKRSRFLDALGRDSKYLKTAAKTS